jgi:hypothetical protein
MSGWRMAALIGAVTAGVLLPKVAPAALVGGNVRGLAARFLALLPAALMGGLTAVGVLGGGGPGLHPRLAVVLAVAAAATIAALSRRTLLSMAAGWAVLIAVLLRFG